MPTLPTGVPRVSLKRVRRAFDIRYPSCLVARGVAPLVPTEQLDRARSRTVNKYERDELVCREFTLIHVLEVDHDGLLAHCCWERFRVPLR